MRSMDFISSRAHGAQNVKCTIFIINNGFLNYVSYSPVSHLCTVISVYFEDSTGNNSANVDLNVVLWNQPLKLMYLT